MKARIAVKDDRATKPMKQIFDTFGTVRGSEFPDEVVIVGGTVQSQATHQSKLLDRYKVLHK